MRKFVWMLALSVLIAAPALADEVWYPPQVIGKQQRSEIRYFMYSTYLFGDKKEVFDEYGYTPHKIRTAYAGRWTEEWKYLELGISFVFDQCCDELIATHTIPVEHRRSWAFQRDVPGYKENLPCDDCDD